MDQNEAFEFFIEVKNKEIQELKDKLERTKAAGDAMINAGIRNRKLLVKRGDELRNYIHEIQTDNEDVKALLMNLAFNWDMAKEGHKGLDLDA